MELLFKLLLLPLAQAIIMYYMSRFRAKVKKDDIVGISYGDTLVVNRSVYVRLEHSVIVLDAQARTYIEVSMDRVYTQDPKTLTDISLDLQGLY